jgi:hypothetical protein
LRRTQFTRRFQLTFVNHVHEFDAGKGCGSFGLPFAFNFMSMAISTCWKRAING